MEWFGVSVTEFSQPIYVKAMMRGRGLRSGVRDVKAKMRKTSGA
jgi:hypothetical protein